jgi:ABC-type phosphate transport system substrate-binding protein
MVTAFAAIMSAPLLGTGKLLPSDPQGRAAADDCLAIVVNRSNPVENLSFVELRKVFRGEQSHWSNGRRVTVVMLESGKTERQAVLTQIYQMDDKDYNNYFLHNMFTGEVHAAPVALASSADVLKYVLNVQGAIGYVRAMDADDSVKVLRVDGVLPCEKDYSIRLRPKSGK